MKYLIIPVAGDCVRRESDQREDGLRRAAFHPDKFDRLKYGMLPILVVLCASLRPSPLHARPVSEPGGGVARAVDVDRDALREKLIKGLRAAREDQKTYIKDVVKRVDEKEFPVSIVYASFRYARARSPAYPFPYFRYALQTLIERYKSSPLDFRRDRRGDWNLHLQ